MLTPFASPFQLFSLFVKFYFFSFFVQFFLQVVGAWTDYDFDEARQKSLRGDDVQFVNCFESPSFHHRPCTGSGWMNTTETLEAGDYVTLKDGGEHGIIYEVFDDGIVEVESVGEDPGKWWRTRVASHDLVKTPDKCMPLPARGRHHGHYPAVQVFVGAVPAATLEELDKCKCGEVPPGAGSCCPAN